VTGVGPEAKKVRPSVVMLVGNDAVTDTRVRKEALAVAALNADVSLIALSTAGGVVESGLGDVRIIRVPVPFLQRETRKALLAHRRRPRRLIGYANSASERAAARNATIRVNEIEYRNLASVRRLWWRGRRFLVRARAAGQRRLDRVQREAWRAVDGLRHRIGWFAPWRRLLPEVDDYELAFAQALDDLRPDVIHAHDVHMIGLAVHSAKRTGAKVVYDAHEYVVGLARYGGRTTREIGAWADLEREFIGRCDRVITVSPPLAEALRRDYHLKALPDVVLNIAERGQLIDSAPGIREMCGLGADVPLLVYSGAVQQARGIHTAVDALAELPGFHLAVVCVPSTATWAVGKLRDHIARTEVGDRVHLLEPVAPDQVSNFLASADVGLIPLRHYPSHEMALTNKLFEYLHAGLPMVVSDCRAQRDFVREHDLGEVHRADDAKDLARAVRETLARRGELRRRLADPELVARYTWDSQVDILQGVYQDMVGSDVLGPKRPVGRGVAQVETSWRPRRTVVDGSLVMGIGPANSAGQAWEWARAAERAVPQLRAHVVAIENGRYDFRSDERVTAATFTQDVNWQNRISLGALQGWTHALFEAGRPILGTRNGTNFVGDAALLRAAGVEVGLVFHGSEIRNPRAHAARNRWSPFRDPGESLTARLQQKYDELHPLVVAFDGPKFVSTPDLLDDVPDAHWLPVVIDIQQWHQGGEVLTRDLPVVLHAPSNSALKGSAAIDDVLRSLGQRGLIEYLRVSGIAPEDMPALIDRSDVVLDQFALGSYGAMAVQALAAGRVVIGHVTESVRSRIPRPVPIVEATPEDVAAVLLDVLADVDRARAISAESVGFARALHDGRVAAEVLDRFFLRPSAAG
jgi:glycosyltransferase involved in cell wall biosynthesis